MSQLGSIGHYATHVQLLEFSVDNTTVTAKVSKNSPPLPVVLPLRPEGHPNGFLSLATRVQRLLKNRHLFPIVEEGVVRFQSIRPDQKTWKEAFTCNFPSKRTPWTLRSDRRISYVFFNTLKTWDWKKGTEEITALPFMSTTALAECPSGHLIAGDDSGKLFYKNKVLDLGLKDPIETITPLSPSRCLVSVRGRHGNSLKAVDLETEKIISDISGSKFYVREDGSILTHSYPYLLIHTYDSTTEKYIERELTERKVRRVNFLSSRKALINCKREGSDCHILDIDSGELEEIPKEVPWEDFCGYFIRRVLYLQDGTLVFSPKKGDPHLEMYKEGSFSSTESKGSSGVNDFIELSDGSIMFATDSRGAGIHVVDREKKFHFSECSPTMSYRHITHLEETPDGSVIVEAEDSVVIFEPDFKEVEASGERVGEVLEQIKNHPNQLPLYHRLGSLLDGQNERACRAYLGGAFQAIKAGNDYQARRFYEKANKLDPTEARLFKPAGVEVGNKRKRALLVGEGDFSFTQALKKKHPHLDLTATELLQPIAEEVKNRAKELLNSGVNILFGVDGEKIHKTFKGRRFERIQWNCPFGLSLYESESFKRVMPSFFQSASQLQLPGDRIHVTLDQRGGDMSIMRQQQNPIALSSASSGYRLIRKRRFGTDRYPDYTHVKTGTEEKYVRGVEKEFIFEKVGRLAKIENAIELMDPGVKTYQVVKPNEENARPEDYYFECSTDEDSSDSEG